MLLSHIILWVRNLGRACLGSSSLLPTAATKEAWRGWRICAQDRPLTVLASYCWLLAGRKLELAVSWALIKAFQLVLQFCSTGASPLGFLGFLTTCSCVSRGSVPRDKDGGCKSFSDLDSKVPGSQFFHIILVKRITKTRPDSTRGQWDSTSQWVEEQRICGCLQSQVSRSVTTIEIVGWCANPL